MAVPLQQKDFSFSAERGSTWGTISEAGPTGLPVEDLEITLEPVAHQIQRARGFRSMHEDDSWQDEAGAIPTARCSMPLTPTLLNMLLPGLLQKSEDWAAAADVYTLYTVPQANLPDFTGDEGYFYSLVRNAPQANHDTEINSAVVSSLSLSIDAAENDRLLYGEFEFIGKGFNRAQTSGGTVTQSSLASPYKFSDIGAVSFGATDILSDFIGCTINLSNGATFIGGRSDGFLSLPMWECTFSIKMLGGTDAETLKGLCHSSAVSTGKAFTVSFGDGTVSEAGELNLITFGLLNTFSIDYSEGEVVTFEGTGLVGNTSSDEYLFTAKYFDPEA